MARETHPHFQAHAIRAVVQRDRRAVRVGDSPRDRQSQAAASRVRGVVRRDLAMKALEDPLARRGRYWLPFYGAVDG